LSHTGTAVKIGNTEDIGSAALGDRVETDGASVVGSWVAGALGGARHDGGSEESDEQSSELHFDCSDLGTWKLVCWVIVQRCRSEGLIVRVICCDGCVCWLKRTRMRV
jgi:hypothetical protein